MSPGGDAELVINLSAGIVSTVVVGIFAVAKFTEGAWLVVVVFPLLVFVLMRLNREYRAEAAILEMFRTDRPELVKYARHRVFVFVNSVDLAVIEALRYGKGLRADELTAVHFMVDAAHAAQLRKRWDHFELDTPLRVVDCPDRQDQPGRTAAGRKGARRTSGHQRDGAAAASDICAAAGPTAARPHRGQDRPGRQPDPGRRGDDRALRRGVADQGSLSRTASSIGSRAKSTRSKRWVSQDEDQKVESYEHPERSPSVITVAGLIPGQRATIEGRVNEVEDITKGRRTLRQVVVGDNSGEITVTFRPGHGGADIQPGQLLRITGKARQSGKRPMWMTDPAYHVVEEPAQTGEESG